MYVPDLIWVGCAQEGQAIGSYANSQRGCLSANGTVIVILVHTAILGKLFKNIIICVKLELKYAIMK